MIRDNVNINRIARLISIYGEEYICYIYHENHIFYYTDIGIFTKTYISHIDYLYLD